MVTNLPVVTLILPDYKLSIVGIYRQHHGGAIGPQRADLLSIREIVSSLSSSTDVCIAGDINLDAGKYGCIPSSSGELYRSWLDSHAKGGRKATKCDGWHLFKKYSELKAERKERAKASKERKAAEKKASATARQGKSKKSAKGNNGPGKKAASMGREQRGKTGPSSSGRARHGNKGARCPAFHSIRGSL